MQLLWNLHESRNIDIIIIISSASHSSASSRKFLEKGTSQNYLNHCQPSYMMLILGSSKYYNALFTFSGHLLYLVPFFQHVTHLGIMQVVVFDMLSLALGLEKGRKLMTSRQPCMTIWSILKFIYMKFYHFLLSYAAYSTSLEHLV